MPAAPEEMTRAARLLLDNVMAPDALVDLRWQDGSRITEPEMAQVMGLALYEARVRAARRNPAQRRALRLLRSLLSPEQRRQLRTRGSFRAVGSQGGVYRLSPGTGQVEGLELRGRHFFCFRTFCLHEPAGAEALPAADRSIAHLLLLSTDEAGFTQTANITERPPGCWNGEWRRQLREARSRRQQRAAEASV